MKNRTQLVLQDPPLAGRDLDVCRVHTADEATFLLTPETVFYRQRIPRHLGLPTAVAPPRPARPPPLAVVCAGKDWEVGVEPAACATKTWGGRR